MLSVFHLAVYVWATFIIGYIGERVITLVSCTIHLMNKVIYASFRAKISEKLLFTLVHGMVIFRVCGCLCLWIWIPIVDSFFLLEIMDLIRYRLCLVYVTNSLRDSSYSYATIFQVFKFAYSIVMLFLNTAQIKLVWMFNRMFIIRIENV